MSIMKLLEISLRRLSNLHGANDIPQNTVVFFNKLDVKDHIRWPDFIISLKLHNGDTSFYVIDNAEEKLWKTNQNVNIQECTINSFAERNSTSISLNLKDVRLQCDLFSIKSIAYF